MPSPSTAEPPAGRVDVHQHLWPAELVEALRARTGAPRLDGWTLLLDGEPPYPVEPTDLRGVDLGRGGHDVCPPLHLVDLVEVDLDCLGAV